MSKEKSFNVEFMIQVTFFKLNSHIIHHKYTKYFELKCLIININNEKKMFKKR